MFSDDTLLNVVQQIVKRQQTINTYVLNTIANRIYKIGTMSTSDVRSLGVLMRNGADAKKLERYLAKMTGLQARDIADIIDEVAQGNYRDAKYLYDNASMDYIPYKDNEQLRYMVEAIKRQTVNTYINLSNTSAFMIPDASGNLVPTPASKAYNKVIDLSIQSASSGTLNYKTFMDDTIKALSRSGMRQVTYNGNGRRTERLDSAVRRNVLDGIRQINQQTHNIVGEQVGANGKEISVHSYPAPDHAPIQGRQFTNDEYEKLNNVQDFSDINGNQFTAIERGIGMWNCRHFAYSIVVGVSKPLYSKKQLGDILKNNEKGYTTKDGEHFTMYQCSQLMRKYELEVRYEKDTLRMAEICKDEKLYDSTMAKISKLKLEYAQLCKGCGLEPRYDKMEIQDL